MELRFLDARAQLNPSTRHLHICQNLPMSESFSAVTTSQIVFLVAGVALWIRSMTVSRKLLPWRGDDNLARWDIPLPDFLLLLFFVFLFMFFGSQAAVYWTDQSGLDAPDGVLKQTVISGYSFHLCSIVAWISFGIYHPSIWPRRQLSWISSTIAAVRTLLFALPVMVVFSLAWVMILQALGMPTDLQDLVGTIHEADNTFYLVALVVLAVVVAPINEELLFRGGLFRYCNKRLPTPLAMLLSAVPFALLHMNWFSFMPLVVLGCFLCLVTLKTGSLKPAMIMHALFNLNSILSILLSPEL